MHDGRWTIGAIVGSLVGLAVTGLNYLLATLTITSFVPLDVANGIIEITPGQVATTTIETLGPWGKRLLEIGGVFGFVLAFGLLGALYAAVMLRRGAPALRAWMLSGALLGLLPLALSLVVQYSVPANRAVLPPGAGSPMSLAVLYGLAGTALGWLLHGIFAAPAATEPGVASRRAFLVRGSGAAVAIAAGSSVLGWFLPRSESAVAGTALPTPAPLPTAPNLTASTAPSLPAASAAPFASSAATTPAASVEALPSASAAAAPTVLPAFVAAAGTRPEITDQNALYVISSATRDPQVNQASWKLEITGLVDTPFSITYDELLALPRHDLTSTQECISNEVGNYLIGNCNWNGVLLKDLLERAGVQAGVVDVVFRAADGYSDSVPLAQAMASTALVVYGVDGSALQVKHGFPARIRIPGLYGVKNVKWLTAIELVTTDYQGYWQQRGWTDDATVYTTAVFDTGNPRTAQAPLKLENGTVALGGIAFAGIRGIRKVEIQADDGDWHEAQLKEPSEDIAWRLWRYDWPAEPGTHTLRARATDGTGEVQTDTVQDTHPLGATGYHTIEVTVAAA